MNDQSGFLEQHNIRLSVVVPVLNEASVLSQLVESLEHIDADQVIIVDGGSDDGTYQWLEAHWAVSSPMDAALHKPNRCLLRASKPGRAVQMNYGASESDGDMIVFLHADTKLPVNAKQEIAQARQRQRLWGRFDVSFIPGGMAMRVIAFFMNWRSRLSGIATGDQAIFVDAAIFKLMGGYAELPLMEDVTISKQLKSYCKPYCSTQKVITSSRRWHEHGVVNTVLMMWGYRLAFFCGVSAERLANSYRHVR